MQDPIKIYEKVESLDHLKWVATDMLEITANQESVTPYRYYPGEFILVFNKQLILVVFIKIRTPPKVGEIENKWNTDRLDIYINYTITNPTKKIFHKIFTGKDRKELEAVIVTVYNNIEKFTATASLMYTNSKIQQNCYCSNIKFRKDLRKLTKQTILT